MMCFYFWGFGLAGGGTGGGGMLLLLLRLFALLIALAIPRISFKVDRNSSKPIWPSNKNGITLSAPSFFFNILIVEAPLEAQNWATFLIVSFNAAGTGAGTTDGCVTSCAMPATTDTAGVRTPPTSMFCCGCMPPIAKETGAIPIPKGPPALGDNPMIPMDPTGLWGNVDIDAEGSNADAGDAIQPEAEESSESEILAGRDCIFRISFSVTYSGNACTYSSGPWTRTIATPNRTPRSASVPGINLSGISENDNAQLFHVAMVVLE